MKRVLYVATVVKTHIMHFHIPYLKMFKEAGWHTTVAARNDYDNPSDCRIPYCDEYIDVAFDRSPVKVANLKAYHQLKKVIDEGEYDIVHCHTPVAAMLTRLAARKARKRGTRVFYTAHGFHFFKGAPLLNWAVYFPIEWLCSFFTDVLITINREDYTLAKRCMKTDRIEYVPGVGVDLRRYCNNRSARMAFCRTNRIEERSIILLSVGELNKNKNHQIVIRALGKCGQENNIHYVVAGSGSECTALIELARQYNVYERVHLLGYCIDVDDLYSAADIFVFPSYREGLSVSLMEAMIHRLPCLVSRIRGNVDLIDSNGGRLFDPYNVDDFGCKLMDILHCDWETMGMYNQERVGEFSVDRIMERMKQIYSMV